MCLNIFKDSHYVAPRRVVLGIRNLGLKSEAIKESASGTGLSAKNRERL